MGRFDLRMITATGFLIFMITSYWQSVFYTDVGFNQLIAPRFVQGIGITLFFTPLIQMLLADMPPEKMASALGLGNFFRILGGSFGTSLSVSIWNNREAMHQSHLVEHINNYNPFTIQILEQLHQLGISGVKAYGVIYQTIINQAFMLATNDIFRLSSWIFGLLFFVIWFAKPTHAKSGGPVAAE